MKVVSSILSFLFCSRSWGTSVDALSQNEIRSLAARALQQDNWDGGSWSGTWKDPVAERPFTLAQPGGQIDGAIMAFRVNPSDSRAGGADTITIVYQVPTLAWCAIGFSNNGGNMVGSEAVIALPETNEVVKYVLGGKSVQLVVPSDRQTLVESGMIQDQGVTTMAFTKIMVEDGEVPIIADGLNTLLGAWGSSNTLGIHSNRQPFNVDLSTGAVEVIAPGEGVGADAVQETQAPSNNDVGVEVDPDGFSVIELDDQLAGATLQFLVNQADPNAGGQDTVTFIYTVPAAGWAGIAFTDNGGFMVGSEAVIGLPDTGEVLKYGLGAKSVAGVLPLGETQQTLINPEIVQNGDTTILTFTKIMVEDGEIPIILGPNTLLGAWGFSNELGIHSVRQPFGVDFVGGGEFFVDDVRKESYWKAHGFIAGIAWGFFSPLAIGASVLRKIFKAPLWFQIHRACNMLVVVSTIVAFGLAVAAINQETPEGASPGHFNPDPNPHRLVGLVIFIIAIVQALLGIFRPHVPEEGQKKSTIRFAWEIVHKFLGFACLGMAIYQVQSGIKLYLTIFASSADYLLVIFWTVIAVLCGSTVIGRLAIGFFNIGGDEPKPVKKQFDDKDDQEQPSA